MDGRSLCLELSQKTDQTISRLFESRFDMSRTHWSIVAIGGYGRNDLCPFSDIDLLLLAHRRTAHTDIEKALKEMMYPLWDDGYTVSYSVRTVKQALRDTKNDFFFRTSLLDARFVCGSKELFNEMVHAMSNDKRFRDSKSFLSDLNAHVEKRHNKCGDASYYLEPDIKEGNGSLRDYHSLMWVIKVASYDPKGRSLPSYLSRVDKEELDVALDHLLKIRHNLHEMSGRKNDRLYFEYQGPLASKMGYRGNGNESAAELLMKQFHSSALTVKSISEAVLSHYCLAFGITISKGDVLLDNDFRLTSGRICLCDNQKNPDRPDLILKVFSHISSLGATMSIETRHHVRNSLSALAQVRDSIETNETFLKIMRGKYPAMALTAMLETGVLERFIPEFVPIKGRTHFDVYHTYTTDVHSIKTVDELNALEKEEPDLFTAVKDKEVLYLAALIHDIGKGLGRPHAITGAPVAGSIAKRLGFSGPRADLVKFLVRYHLLLPDTAYRRDLSEEKVALDCARLAQNEQTLSMLYLISVADARATGPRAWDEWKASLLRELYIKATHSLQRGILRDPDNMVILEERWNQLISEVPLEQGSRPGGRLWVLPQAYILHTEFVDIKHHLEQSGTLKNQDDIMVDVQAKGEHAAVSIITRDRPGLFAMLTGILTINHLDIVSAKIFTWLDGIAVDEFTVLTPWQDYANWGKISEQFKLAAKDQLDINEQISSTKPLKNGSTIRSSSIPVVNLDNNSSDFFTIIDVHTPQRFGLLFHVAQAIAKLGLNIHRAFLSHTGDPCTDVFYVVDEFGEKITDEELDFRIVVEITHAIERLGEQRGAI
jgi:[protein-PII] uridylyltransferase